MSSEKLSNYTSLYDTEISNGLSVNSGVFALLDPNIAMQLNDYGLFEPVLKSQQKSSARQNLSAVSAMWDGNSNEEEIADELYGRRVKHHHEHLGFYEALYAGHVKIGTYRAEGSSGGVTTWLLVKMLENNMIDGVIHVRGNNSKTGLPYGYAVSYTVEEIRAGSKSKYYPAEFSGAIRSVLKSGKRFALVGIPSFITEFRLLSQIDASFASLVPYTFALIAAHQKSTRYAEAIAWECGIVPDNLKEIDFRVKGPGIPVNSYTTRVKGTGRQGSLVVNTASQAQLFVADWGLGFFKARFSDYIDDAFGETADVTLGDAWLPQYEHDENGNNVVIVRNPDINDLIQEGISSGELAFDEINDQTVLASQRGLIRHTILELPYRQYLAKQKGLWVPQRRKQPSKSLALNRQLIQKIRLEASEKSHHAYAEARRDSNWLKFVKVMGPISSKHKAVQKIARLVRR